MTPERVPGLDVDAERRLVENQEIGIVGSARPSASRRRMPPDSAPARSVTRSEPDQLDHLRHACVAVLDREQVGGETQFWRTVSSS